VPEVAQEGDGIGLVDPMARGLGLDAAHGGGQQDDPGERKCRVGQADPCHAGLDRGRRLIRS